MNISRRQKFMSSGRTTSFSDKKVDIVLDLKTLDAMCAYVLSENRTIKRSQLINMRNLFDTINLELYRSDVEKKKRIDFIRKGLEGRILKNLKDPTFILQYINGGIIDTNNTGLETTQFLKLNADELRFINETVSSALKYTFIYNDIDVLHELTTRFKTADYVSKQYIVNEIEAIVVSMQNKFRRANASMSSETEFRLRPDVLQDSFRDIYDKITNPSNKLLTGMQGMNEMLGGGWYSGRTYMILGITGGGKSLSLLDIIIQMKKYNKNYQCKDPAKIPCIVYLTMENTVEETVQRLFEMSTGTELESIDFEEALRVLTTEGELYLNEESPIDIIIKYQPNKSVDTGYLYTVCEDLEDEGYEVIAFVQDHIGRIRSTENLADTRLELGAVANEFKVFAQLKDIPFITNFHLNRDAIAKIDEATNCNKSDLVRMLGKANVAESQVMINNIDGCFMITQEWDTRGNRWLGVMRTKKRFKASERAVIYLPYTEGSPKLIEDYYSPVPVFKDTLKEGGGLQYNNTNKNNKVPSNIKSTPYGGSIKEIDEILIHQNNSNIPKETNIFDLTNLPVSTCGQRADLKNNTPKKIIMVRG